MTDNPYRHLSDRKLKRIYRNQIRKVQSLRERHFSSLADAVLNHDIPPVAAELDRRGISSA